MAVICQLKKSNIELTKKTTVVYNFQVEDFHTYHVGENCVLVHNADYDVDIVSKNIKERISNDELNPPTKRGNAPTSKKMESLLKYIMIIKIPMDHFMKKLKLIIDWVVIIKKPPSL